MPVLVRVSASASLKRASNRGWGDGFIVVRISQPAKQRCARSVEQHWQNSVAEALCQPIAPGLVEVVGLGRRFGDGLAAASVWPVASSASHVTAGEWRY